MAVKKIDRTVGFSRDEGAVCGLVLDHEDDEFDFEESSDDSEPAIWPRGEDEREESPPAVGRCRRVPHDW